jgi:hypothetical protein
MDDYRFAGGAEGLLTAYISDRLERFGVGEQEGVMKALLALADLDTNQRIAEGKTADELSAVARLSPERLGLCLEYLASSHVRLLEKVALPSSDQTYYRLPHERVVPSLRQLTGAILAEVDQARLTFESAFRSWLNSRSRRFLLSGGELKKILQNRQQFYPGELPEEKVVFLEKSLRKRLELRTTVVALALFVGAISIFGGHAYRNMQSRRDLAQWGLPPDLYSYQNQLEEMTLSAPVSNFGWLKAKHLRQLRVKSDALRLVNDLPRNVTALDLAGCIHLSSLAGLERLSALTTLNLSGNPNLSSLAGLEKLSKLTTLRLSGDTNLSSLAGLEKLSALTTLDLSRDTNLKSLREIEKLGNLESLDFTNYSILGLKELAPLSKLRKLNLRGTKIKSLEGLPPSVTNLLLGD